jgi:hypothetical protein
VRVVSTTLTQLCGIGALTASKILGPGVHSWSSASGVDVSRIGRCKTGLPHEYVCTQTDFT